MSRVVDPIHSIRESTSKKMLKKQPKRFSIDISIFYYSRECCSIWTREKLLFDHFYDWCVLSSG
jgi:hypothetical protein